MFLIGRKIRNEEIPRLNTFTPYFTAYLIAILLYTVTLKNRGERLIDFRI